MDSFNQRKKSILSKIDKSSIGEWDKKIVSLCNKINKLKDFYTTSSCSGRIVVMQDKSKKGPGLFEFVSHDEVGFNKFTKILQKIKSKNNSKFKVDPPIIHIICRDLISAKKILKKGQLAGFKRSGILSIGKNIVVELNSTEKLEFPIIRSGKILVDEGFLKIILKLSNDKLRSGLEKIRKLQENL